LEERCLYDVTLHTFANAAIQNKYITKDKCLRMEGKIISLVLTAVAVSSLLGTSLDTTGNYSTMAQVAASGAAVSMAKGSQSADNPEFYVPGETTVKAGETVTWKNDDTAIHTATSGKDATPDGKFDTSLVSSGQTSKPIAMPNEPGQFPYFCTLHPWMTGMITIG
jgi:plastocyanin